MDILSWISVEDIKQKKQYAPRQTLVFVCLLFNRPTVSLARAFRNSCIRFHWFGYARIRKRARKWKKEATETPSHRLWIAFTYMKNKRTLHVPVVWPSAPCTQDITALTARAKIDWDSFAPNVRILEATICFFFVRSSEFHVFTNRTTFVRLRHDQREIKKKKLLNKCHAPKTHTFFFFIFFLRTQVFIDATNARTFFDAVIYEYICVHSTRRTPSTIINW